MHCRFHYSCLPSPQTVIARERQPDMCSKDQADEAIATLVAVKKVLEDKDTPEDLTLDEILDKYRQVRYYSYLKYIQSMLKNTQ